MKQRGTSGTAPAVLDGGGRVGVLPLQQVPAPVQVPAVEPVVVDRQRVCICTKHFVIIAGRLNRWEWAPQGGASG